MLDRDGRQAVELDSFTLTPAPDPDRDRSLPAKSLTGPAKAGLLGEGGAERVHDLGVDEDLVLPLDPDHADPLVEPQLVGCETGAGEPTLDAEVAAVGEYGVADVVHVLIPTRGAGGGQSLVGSDHEVLGHASSIK